MLRCAGLTDMRVFLSSFCAAAIAANDGSHLFGEGLRAKQSRLVSVQWTDGTEVTRTELTHDGFVTLANVALGSNNF